MTEEFSSEELSYASTPAGFAELVLGMDLYPKQVKVLNALTKSDTRVSYLCANNGGKTTRVITALILWHLAMFPKGKVKSTSGSWIQIVDQLRPSLAKYKDKFPSWKFLSTPYIETPEGGFWRGFSTNEPGRAEGDHADGEDRPLLFIVDEAKTVDDLIFQAVERCVAIDRPTRLLIASSPGFSEGHFFQSQRFLKKYYKCFQQTADDTPHIPKEYIARLREKWAGFPSFAASMLGEDFMPMVEDALISMKDLDFILANPPKQEAGEVTAFCDFAWSADGDENVLAVCNGNKVEIELAFNAEDLHSICQSFSKRFKELGLKSYQISGDEGGGGKFAMDCLRDDYGFDLGRVNNGARAQDDEHYQNAAAEMWGEGSKKITARQIILPNNVEMRGQMLSRKRIKGSQGRIAVESKRDMKKRGVPSPDLADAVFGAISPSGGYGTGELIHVRPMQVGNYTPIAG